MPVIVITKNTTPQHTPYGAIDTQFDRIEDTHMEEAAPSFIAYSNQRSIGPGAGDLYTPLIRAEDLHQIPSNATNIQARLYVYMQAVGFGSFTAEARGLLKYFLQYGASFNDYTLDLAWDTAGALAGTDRGASEDSEVIASDGWLSFDIPLMTAAYIANPRLNYGVGLFPVQPASGFRFWDGSFAGTDGQRPEWHVSYDVPASGGGDGELVKPVETDLVRELPRDLITSGGGGGPNPVPTVETRRMFVFGHSLFLHATGIFNAFTNTGFSMGDLSRQSANNLCIQQSFGQLRDQTIPPVLGTQQIFFSNQFDAWFSGAWPSANWTDSFIMASNFEQTSKTPATFATESDPVLSYVDTNSPSTQIIIYEHWAEPTQYGYTVGPGPTMAEPDWTDYKNDHRQGGQYHTWHVGYQDAITTNGYSVTMIPVGPIIFDALQTEAYLSGIQYGDLFVDGDPHGTATTYYLAALICYIALYGAPNASFSPIQSSFILAAVRDNYTSLVSFIQSRLTFYGNNGVNLPT